MTTTVKAPAKAETLLWAILRRFEAHALARYEDVAPELASEEKRALVATLNSRGAEIDSDPLDRKSSALIDMLSTGARSETLINQAVLLELVGKAIYASAAEAAVTEETRALCALGGRAADAVIATATRELRDELATGEAFFAAFIKTSPELLKKLMPFAETLDHEIGPAFGLSFADLIGEFVSEVDNVTSALGVDRKKLIAFLTNVMMEA